MKKKLTCILLTAIMVVSLSGTAFAGRTLSNGTSGNDVYVLQQVLAAYGYLTGEYDGYFGYATQAALASLQADLGLVPDGVAGPTTCAFLGISTNDDLAIYNYSNYNSYGYGSYDYYGTTISSSSLSKGMSGSDVYALQSLLAAYGYFYDTPSGYFGDMTEAAVTNFQYAYGLDPCGIAGPKTIGMLTGDYSAADTYSTGYSYDYGAAIVEAAHYTPSTAQGYCAAWVSNVLVNAGVVSCSPGYNANDYWANVCYSTDVNDLQPGMIIAVRNSNSYLGRIYGHVGIYMGDGLVTSSIGYLETLSLDEWIRKYNNYDMGSYAAWGFMY